MRNEIAYVLFRIFLERCRVLQLRDLLSSVITYCLERGRGVQLRGLPPNVITHSADMCAHARETRISSCRNSSCRICTVERS